MLDNLNEKLRSLFDRHSKVGEPQVADEFLEHVDGMPIQQIAELVSALRTDIKDKKELYEVYEAMSLDSLIGGALAMWVSDACQIDEEMGHMAWAAPLPTKEYITSEKADDKKGTLTIDDVIDDINDFLHNKVKIDDILPVIAHRVCVFGEAYIKTYYSEYDDEKEYPKENRNNALIDAFGISAFDLVDNPLEVSEVIEYNRACGFLVKDNFYHSTHYAVNAGARAATSSTDLYSLMDYVHFCHDRGRKRWNVTVSYRQEGHEVDTERTFTTRFGTSFLEAAREAWEVLQLLELILLICRFNRSSYYRIFQIETGGATRLEINRILQEFKKAINKSEAISLPQGKYQSKNQPLPMGGNIYVPVKNGKGQVSVETISPDQNLRELLDLDYYLNKLYAALRTPRAFLGGDESSPQGVGNISLLIQDIRYARTILDLIDVLRKGIKDWCDWYLVVNGKGDWVDKYEIKTAKILTAMENTTLEMQNQRISFAQSFISLFEQLQVTDPVKTARYVCEVILHDKDMFDKIKSDNPQTDDGEGDGGW